MTWSTSPAGYRVRIRARGKAVLASAMLNRGTAFTEPERRALGLTGLLPSGVTTLASQLERVYAQYGRLVHGAHGAVPSTPMWRPDYPDFDVI